MHLLNFSFSDCRFRKRNWFFHDAGNIFLFESGAPGITGGFGKISFPFFLKDHVIISGNEVLLGQGIIIRRLNDRMSTDSGFGCSLYFIAIFIFPTTPKQTDYGHNVNSTVLIT